MTTLIILLTLILLVVIIFQIAKVTEISNQIRGKAEVFYRNNDRTGVWLVVFGVLFLVLTVGSFIYYKDSMMGYGPLTSASEHGVKLDGVFNTTLIVTGIVFLITQWLLFWYSYKYRQKKGKKAVFLSHDNTLEYIWTGVPALVMTFLVVKGLVVWNEVMADVRPDEEVIEIEATGYQFAWDIRHPGPDGLLGEKRFDLIESGTNDLGINFKDDKSLDDIIVDQIVLPVNKKVRVRITAKDVLHNFFLPHFRVKMDAVPGLPTYFIFTPTVTTEEFRERLAEHPNWQGYADPTDPSIGTKAETFDYELACAELCGTGHFSMRKIVKIVSEAEYEGWLEKQNSFYMSQVRNTDLDPYKGQLIGMEIKQRSQEFKSAFSTLMNSEDETEAKMPLKYINFETGSATLTENSKYELDNVLTALIQNPSLNSEISGFTDNVGDPANNLTLSKERAASVVNYLTAKGLQSSRITAKGYGEANPVSTNDTEEGRAENRRIEFKILK